MINWHITPFKLLSKEELYTLLRFRIGIFMLEQNAFYEDLDGLDFKAIHFLGWIQKKLVAYARLYINSEQTAMIQRVCIHPDYRGQKLGASLMDAILNYIDRQDHLSKVELSAQYHLRSFYEKLGFQSSGEPYDDAGIQHIKMIKQK